MAHEHCTAPSSTRPRLYVAFELSKKTWRLASSDGGDRVREKAIHAGDREALELELAAAKRRFHLDADAEVLSCYEAGLDAFWVHRLLERIGLNNVVVDAASMKVDRKARRAKSDRIDARLILADLVRYSRGEKNVWRVVHIPSEEAEDIRRLHRELGRLKKEATQHSNRIWGLLATQGITYQITGSTLKHLLANLDTIEGPNGNRLLPYLKTEITREKARLDLVCQQICAIDQERKERVKAADSPVVKKVAALALLKGVGVDSAWLLTMEFFGWRDFKNRRQVGGAAGMGGTPFNSGNTEREQGISKAGNERVRSRVVELAWLWLRHQPKSKLSVWFNARFAGGGKRLRRIGIVALARRLLIDLWHFVDHGVVPDGAKLKVN